MKEVSRMTTQRVCGLDLGDKTSALCICSAEGQVQEHFRVKTSAPGLARRLQNVEPMRIALEAGAQSPWVSRLLKQWGHEVVVANPRKVRLIGNTRKKNDRIDALSLADLASVRPRLLAPIEHVSQQAQADRAVLRSRDALVRTRSALISHCRGVAKAMGGRLPSCEADSFAKKAAPALPPELAAALEPILKTIAELTASIRAYDRQVEELLAQRPLSARLRQVPGVGPITSLAFLLALGEDPSRFTRSRQVGAYFGLVPAQRDSGASQPQLRISKEGNPYVRRLLVQCAHYILGPFGKDSDLRRWALRLVERGGKTAKKRATVALARKLAVLLHRLLVTGLPYEPLRSAQLRQAA
jgi:transposase